MIKGLSFAKRWAVRIMCALALLLAGFAYKPTVAEYTPIPPQELAQYVLPDGTNAVFCLPSEDGKAGHGSHDPGSGCEFCRLTASVTLPAPADMVGMPTLQPIDNFVPTRIEAFYRQLFPPNTSPRGPPSGLTA
ncbi:hypothetical protein ACQKGL_28290 [Ensifer adhaerens]|uniref:hypothetical protein n=1 Tax=Ensifer adhaerens TaxID=106592 RepID=UPI003D0828FA